MRLLPRHYVLIAVIVLVGIYNFVRLRRARTAGPATVAVQPAGPVEHTPAWNAFDQAAALRDAGEEQFAPALHELQQQVDTAQNGPSPSGPSPSNPSLQDVKGCRTWLLFYRQGVLHPSRDPSWKQRSGGHLDTCVKLHRDVG